MATVTCCEHGHWRRAFGSTCAVGFLAVVPMMAFAQFGPGLVHVVGQGLVSIDRDVATLTAAPLATARLSGASADDEQVEVLDNWAFTSHQPPPPPPVHAPPSHHRGYR